jgi:HlyD family secretion protein
MRIGFRRAAYVVAALAALFLTAVLLLNGRRDNSRAVQTEPVRLRDITQVVAASGRVRARTAVEVSAETTGKVVRLGVEEGDVVRRGQFLVQLDPISASEKVNELRASLEAARASYELAQVEFVQAQVEHRRQERLFHEGLIPEDDFQKVASGFEAQTLRKEAARQQIARLEAMLRTAEHELEKVVLRSDIDGVVTRVNIAEGERAFVGNFNNPGTVLLEIADLAVIEAVVEVDEVDVMQIARDQRATVRLDALPDRALHARVLRTGHSPIFDTGPMQAARFEVVLEVLDPIPEIKPGLTCEAEIVTAHRQAVPTVPIQALTRRLRSGLEGTGAQPDPEAAAGDLVEGVLVVDGASIRFRPISLGISGDRYFEVTEGLSEGDLVVTGPFDVLRSLEDGDRVHPTSGS